MKKIVIVIFFSLLYYTAWSHGGEKHKDDKSQPNDSTEKLDTILTSVIGLDTALIEVHEDLTPSQSQFPSLHPLVVHIPIMLIIVAFFIQLFYLLKAETSLSLLVWFLLFFGFIGAVISSYLVHPHTSADISVRAFALLKEHEDYAYITVWLSGIALIIKTFSHFFLKRKLWLELLVAMLIMVAGVTVALAGHHGAMLVHIEGIGPQGRGLEIH